MTVSPIRYVTTITTGSYATKTSMDVVFTQSPVTNNMYESVFLDIASGYQIFYSTNQFFTHVVAYFMAYEISPTSKDYKKWVPTFPQWEIAPGSLHGSRPSSGLEPALPIGTGVYITQSDLSYGRKGRMILKPTLSEAECTAVGNRWGCTSFTTGFADVMEDEGYWGKYCSGGVNTEDVYFVNLHKGHPSPAMITAMQIRYVDKYRAPRPNTYV